MDKARGEGSGTPVKAGGEVELSPPEAPPQKVWGGHSKSCPSPAACISPQRDPVFPTSPISIPSPEVPEACRLAQLCSPTPAQLPRQDSAEPSRGAEISLISDGCTLAWKPLCILIHRQASNLKKGRDLGDADDKV